MRYIGPCTVHDEFIKASDNRINDHYFNGTVSATLARLLRLTNCLNAFIIAFRMTSSVERSGSVAQ